MDKVLHSSKRHDWQTPQWLVECIHDAFDEIEMDPCAPADLSNPCRANRAFWRDGLIVNWREADGLVYCNPPYGRALKTWVEKAIAEHTFGAEVLLLTPARTDTKWFGWLAQLKGAQLCFLRGRLRFGGATAGAPFPSLLTYLGSRRRAFRSCFEQFGWMP